MYSDMSGKFARARDVHQRERKDLVLGQKKDSTAKRGDFKSKKKKEDLAKKKRLQIAEGKAEGE